MNSPPARVIVLWCPDWPVTAAARSAGLATDAPIALILKNTVFAASAAARAEGVRRGLRVREAQSRYPALQVLDYDPALDAQAFEPVIEGIEQLAPGVQVLRPGMLVLQARGPARYYGGEHAAALALTDRADELGAAGARAGVADGTFTAERAARATGVERTRMVPVGGSAAFLAPLPIGLLEDTTGSIVTLLRRLGIQNLGELAALSPVDVRTRFGAVGARLHALAAGSDSLPVTPRTPPPELEIVIDFEPALDRVDQVAFAVRARAEEFVAGLVAHRLVATAIRVGFDSEAGDSAERVWQHPRSFAPADVVDRVGGNCRVRGRMPACARVSRECASPPRPWTRSATTRPGSGEPGRTNASTTGCPESRACSGMARCYCPRSAADARLPNGSS